MSSAVGATAVRAMGSGTLKDIGKLENINRLYQPGDMGEMQLFLGPNATDRVEVNEAASELEKNLRKQGMKPWPNRREIVTVDWPARTIRLFFEAVAVSSGSGVRGVPQAVGISPVIGLGAVIGALMLASKIAFGISLILTALKAFGVPIPDRISRISDAVLLVTSMAFAYRYLRGVKFLGKAIRMIPKRYLLGAGLLIFVLLKPGTAWKALKYVFRKAKEALPDMPNPWLAVVLIGGVVAAAILVPPLMGNRARKRLM